jgi:hypothetical protein
MINRKEKNQRQAELFLELTPFNGPALPDLPPEKAIELKRVVGDLLLHAASGNAKAPKGCDRDA